MRQFILITFVCLLFFSVNAQNDDKLRRSESFWGLHFDRHTRLNDDNIGASLTEEMVDSMLTHARPDYKYMNHQNIVKSISACFPTRRHNATKFGMNQILMAITFNWEELDRLIEVA